MIVDKSSKDLYPLSENLSPISVIRQLYEQDLFFVTTRTLADIFDLPRPRVYQLTGQLKTLGLLEEVENGKFLVLGFEPERVLANPLFVASQLVTPGYVSLLRLVYRGNRFSEDLDFNAADWERDLRPLLPQYVEPELALHAADMLRALVDRP